MYRSTGHTSSLIQYTNILYTNQAQLHCYLLVSTPSIYHYMDKRGGHNVMLDLCVYLYRSVCFLFSLIKHCSLSSFSDKRL